MAGEMQPGGYYSGPGSQTAMDWTASSANIALSAFQGGDPNSLLAKLLQVLGGASPMFGGAQSPGVMSAQTFMAPAMAGIMAGPSTPGAGSALGQLQARAVGGFNLQQAFGSLMNAGGMGAGGMGLGMGAQQEMLGTMQGMTQPGVTMGDMSMIAGMGTQGGFFRGITDVRQARTQLQNLSKQVIEMSRELSMTIQDVSQAMNQAASLGATGPAGARASAQRTIATAQLTGTDPSQVFAMQTGFAQMGRQFGLGTEASGEAGRMAWGRAGWAERTGTLSQGALFNATGAGGDQGAAALATWFAGRGMQSLDRSQTNWMMAAAIDPNSIRAGNIQLDQSKLQGMLFGANDPQAIERMRAQANQNLALLQRTPGAQATWMNMQPEMMDQFMAATGGLGPLQFAASAVARMGIGEDDPNYKLYVARVFAQQTGGPTRGAGFRETQRMIGAAVEGGLVGTGAGVAAEQAAVFGARQEEMEQRNAEVRTRQQEASINRVIERQIGDFERRTTAGLVAGAESITASIGLQLGVVPEAATSPITAIAAAGRAGSSSRDFFALAGAVAPTFRDSAQDLARAQDTIADLRTKIDQTTDPTVRSGLEAQLRATESSVAQMRGSGYRMGSQYWRGDAAARGRTSAETVEHLKLTTEQVENIRSSVGQSAAGWDAVTAAWQETEGNADFRDEIAGKLGMSSTELAEQLKTGTFMDVLLKADPTRAAAAYAQVLRQGSGRTGAISREEGESMMAGAAADITAYRTASMGGKLSMGEVGKVLGRPEGYSSREQAAYAEALSAVTKTDKLGAGGQAVLEAIGRDPGGIGGPLARFMEANSDKLESGMTWAEIVKQSELPQEKQDMLLNAVPEEYRQNKITRGELTTMLGGAAGAALEGARRDILASGLLGQDAGAAYEKHATDQGFAGTFASTLASARAKMVRGGGENIIGAMGDVTSAVGGALTGSRRDFRSAMGVLREGGSLGQAVAARLERARSQRESGGGWGAGEVTGFAQNFGVDVSQIEGISSEQAQILKGGGTAADRLLAGNQALQDRLTGAVVDASARAIQPPGRQAEQSGDQRQQGISDATQATQSGFTNALQPMLPLPVKLVIGATTWSMPPGTPPASDPPQAGTGETPPVEPAG